MKAPLPMLVVPIEKPEDEPLGEWFERLRSWLDRNECQNVTFTRALNRADRVVYRLTFGDNAKAQRFSVTFARYLAQARQAEIGSAPEETGAWRLGSAEESLA